MAKKRGTRVLHKEVENVNKNHESYCDEITLRDEILKLKRQVLILRRTNEQYLVKLRKYEDEFKRKDKHLEQLMDPRKNSDITKVLSTKGAAILMNLKDQNNALIQMILNKDLHIRRLAAEIKMSKLYASTRKNENYRAEITRLRNLLIKSQETLKENVQQQTRSICVSGNSPLEFFSSSEQSTPRDLDELRFTILNLESHVKYSNDLLAKKNQEISLLTDELNFLRKFCRYKTSENKAFDFLDHQHYKDSAAEFTTFPDHIVSTKISSQDILDVFEKDTNHDNENIPHSAPAALAKRFSTVDSSPKYTFQSQILEQRAENEAQENSQSPVNPTIKQDNKKAETNISLLGKSVFHIIATDEIKKEEETVSNFRKTVHIREKWKKAFYKYKELKKLKTLTTGSYEKMEKVYAETTGETDIKKTEKEIQNYQLLEENQTSSDLHEDAISPESSMEEINEKRSRTSTSISESDNEMWPSSKKNSSVLDKESLKDEMQQNRKRQSSSDSTTEFPNAFEEKNSNNFKSLREVYRQSLDSSFDSENSFSVNQEVQKVQVKAQINCHSYNNHRKETISESNFVSENNTENGGCRTPDHDFNDDDDVIVREK